MSAEFPNQTHILFISDQTYHQLQQLAENDSVEATLERIVGEYTMPNYDSIRATLQKTLDYIDTLRPREPVPFTAVGDLCRH